MADMMDAASDVTEQTMESHLEVIRRRDAENKRLARAISENEGIVRECEDCGAIIPRARLLAVPTARRCASCQEEAESHRR